MKKLMLVAGVVALFAMASCSKSCHCKDGVTGEEITNAAIENYTQDMCKQVNMPGVLECTWQ